VPEHDARVKHLLSDFLDALEEVTAGVEESDIVPPLMRSIQWLRKLKRGTSTLSTSSSPSIPSLGSEDSPYALIDRMMWPTTP